ncbi:carboxymuconolactone decarboxylase family protein [Balneatrix alpica]|uniref:carboxymuconolactone decarboxylase family protein n=1 Tax=Balneatrix alpica TaxID=75684 RepID=UPI00273A0DA6|nr:carboxymuconolactone decarboxylase family protein [Balneatrix alpica]
MQSRLSKISREQLSDEQQVILDSILASRGNLDGPFLAWIHSPGLAGPAQQLGAFCRYHSQLPLRLSELAILVTAAWWQSQAEWLIHAPIALREGVPPEVVEALRLGQTPLFADDESALIYQIGQSLYQHKRIAPELYLQAVNCFGETALVELIGIYGYYALVAMTLNCFDMRPTSSTELPFDEPDTTSSSD